MPPAWATLSAMTWPMPEEAPVITTYLPVERLARCGVAAGGLVEVVLPVAPQRAGVGLEVGHARCPSRPAPSRCAGSRTPAGTTCAPAPPPARRAGRRSGRARACAGAGAGPATSTSASGRSGAREQRPSSPPVVRRSTGVANCGAPAAAQKVLIISTTGCGSGLTRWNASPSRSGQVGEVVHRGGDVVDRHHVGVAEVDADQRQPGGQAVAQQLDQREEVVGAVDLVHVAGLGVADHDRRPVDPPRDGRLARGRSSRTRTSCGGTARAGAWPSSNMVSSKAPWYSPAAATERHLVEAAGLERLGQLEGVAGAADVHRLVGGVVGGHVVDRGEVEEVVDRRRGARSTQASSTPRPARRRGRRRPGPPGRCPTSSIIFSHARQRALAAPARRSSPSRWSSELLRRGVGR